MASDQNESRRISWKTCLPWCSWPRSSTRLKEAGTLTEVALTRLPGLPRMRRAWNGSNRHCCAPLHVAQPNHVHPVVVPETETALATTLKPLHLKRAPHVNWTHNLTGRLLVTVPISLS